MFISFKNWFIKTQFVEGECNCWLEEHFDWLLTSTKEVAILELCQLMKEYISFVNKLKLESSN